MFRETGKNAMSIMKTKKNSRKVLIVSFYFPPYFNPGAIRMGKFAKYLPECGWEPRILTVNRSPNTSEVMTLETDQSYIYKTSYFILADLVRNKLISNAVIDTNSSIRQVDKGKIWNKLVLKSLRIFDPIYETPIINKLVSDPIGWYPYALKKGEEILADEKFDVILSTFNPSLPHLIASQLKRQTGIPWVADFRDLWSHNPLVKKTQPFRFLEERWERMVIKNCDFLTSVSEPLVKDLEAFHTKKAEVVSNGFDEDDFSDNVSPTLKFTITYTGQIYDTSIDLTPLFEALAELKTEGKISPDNIDVRFFGRFLINDPGVLSKKYCLEDIVKTYGFIPFKESIKKQKESTILLLLVRNDPSAEGIITSKLFEYMASGKPVLVIGYQCGSLNLLVHESGIGTVVNKTIEVKEILVKWINEFEQYHEITSYYAPKPEVIKLYSRKEETKKLAHIFDDVCSGK